MPRVLRYAQRHVGFDGAHGVAAGVFTVAWRRWPDVPETTLPWLIGVARRTTAAGAGPW
jgi:predicted RNA polymerase sigma factor